MFRKFFGAKYELMYINIEALNKINVMAYVIENSVVYLPHIYRPIGCQPIQVTNSTMPTTTLPVLMYIT